MSSRDNLLDPTARPVFYSTNHDENPTESQPFRDQNTTVLMDVPPSSPSFEPNLDQLRFLETRKRLLNKKGRLKAVAQKVPEKMKLYLADVFTTMIDLKWRWVALLFCLSYVFSWLFFGTWWWIIVLARSKDVCVTEVCIYELFKELEKRFQLKACEQNLCPTLASAFTPTPPPSTIQVHVIPYACQGIAYMLHGSIKFDNFKKKHEKHLKIIYSNLILNK